MALKYSGDPNSHLNSSRREFAEAKLMLSLANQGITSRSGAMRSLNYARTKLKQVLYGVKPSHYRCADFTTTIAGIPCGIAIDSYKPALEWKQHTFPGAGPGDCDPPELAEVEFTVLDRKGYPAQWLRNKADESKLESEVIDWCES